MSDKQMAELNAILRTMAKRIKELECQLAEQRTINEAILKNLDALSEKEQYWEDRIDSVRERGMNDLRQHVNNYHAS